ncbi:ATP-dependent DNA ligase [Hydrogenophaga sp. YM1]|uniref:ATP-dependent DNA ligase n=1 Tax=Hydrogenophaga sp. YM1 TaxID=2806262 RepID=UPI00195B34A4|nr:ATP-dependent DNA ligase [Hydrogenophaga sp. YM1]QRR35279.1 ATP-dependent DNA ligase [Hydrogenophaga sp. YM1]
MKRFGALFAELDASTATHAKVAALVRYLREAPDEDAAWAVYFLAGGKPRQLIRTAQLRALALRASGLPEWLFEESYQSVGDLAETIALVLPAPAEGGAELGLHGWMTQRLLPLRGADEATVAAAVLGWWAELDSLGRFLFVKLVGGGFRVGVSQLLAQRAVAEFAGLDPKLVAARMMGYTSGQRAPTAEAWRAIVAPAEGEGAAARDPSQPYPFFLASALAGAPEATLGEVGDWFAEWKFDGIRGQIVKRAGRAWVWSRGEELMTERFPELERLAAAWPDGTVVDGEIVAWDALAAPLPGFETPGRPAPFATLQQRIARKTLTARVLADAPVGFIAHDLLERGGQDLRGQPQHARRAALQALARACAPPLPCSPLLGAADWATLAAWRARSRELGVEGLMLKHRDGAYGTGRVKRSGEGERLAWWKWKIDPFTVDGVLIYAQAGHGRRASVYTDYSFAVWNRTPRDPAEAQAVVDAIADRRPANPQGLQLVSFTKAYSGLSDAEFQAVDAVIRETTLEHFGPVRSVRPTLVVELAFEGIARSKRHKSGVALRFPRMLRVREDKPLHEAGTLGEVQALLPGA